MQTPSGILSSAGAVAWIALVNVATYLAAALIPGLSAALALPWDVSAAMAEPWRLVSYSLVHLSPAHLAVNTAVLIVGGIWLLSRRTFAFLAAVYVGGIGAGGSLFLLCGLFVPGAEVSLSGASAGVCAVLASAAVACDGCRVRVGRRSLHIGCRIVLAVLFALMASGLVGHNPAGAAAHIGGLTFGALIAVRHRRRALISINSPG